MSGVLARFRKVSSEEYYRVALDIQQELTGILLSKKYVPESYRDVYSYPTLELCQQFLDVLAYDQEEAKHFIFDLYRRVQYMLTNLFRDKKCPPRLDKLCELLVIEEKLLCNK